MDTQPRPESVRTPKVGKRSWADTKEHRAETFPPGPTTAEELGNWPARLAASLTMPEGHADAELTLRLHTNLARTLMFSTEYSGFDCPREALRLGVEGLRCLHSWTFEPHPLRAMHACDVAPTPQNILMEISEKFDGSSSCVFMDLLDRLPSAARDWIDAASPPVNASRAEKTEAHDLISKWVIENRAWLFTCDTRSRCLVHHADCLVYPGRASDRDTPEAPSGSSGVASDDAEACCGNPTCSGRIEQTKPLFISCSGVSCLPWTSEGSSAGKASPCEIPHIVWVAESSSRSCRRRMSHLSSAHLDIRSASCASSCHRHTK